MRVLYGGRLVHGVCLLKNRIQHICKQTVLETCYTKYKQILSESSMKMDRTASVFESDKKREIKQRESTEQNCSASPCMVFHIHIKFPFH